MPAYYDVGIYCIEVPVFELVFISNNWIKIIPYKMKCSPCQY